MNKIINDHKTQCERKIQLTIAISFMASKGTNETRTMHSKNDNIEIMIGNETEQIIKTLFDSILRKYQKGLKKSMKRSKFVFDSVDLLHYKPHKISLNCDG